MNQSSMLTTYSLSMSILFSMYTEEASFLLVHSPGTKQCGNWCHFFHFLYHTTWDQTHDLLHSKQKLYQLIYLGKIILDVFSCSTKKKMRTLRGKYNLQSRILVSFNFLFIHWDSEYSNIYIHLANLRLKHTSFLYKQQI